MQQSENLLRKLTTSKWGTSPHVLRTSALALSYSTAKYTCPVWEQLAHAKRLYQILNESCHLITACLKRTNGHNLHLLAGIAPPRSAEKKQASYNVQNRHMTLITCCSTTSL